MLADAVERAVADWVVGQGWESPPAFEMERPADPAHGDYATAFCLQAAKAARRAPRDVAAALREHLLASPAVVALVASIDIAGPGFLNFTLSRDALVGAAATMLAAGDDVGRGVRERPLHILLEFVSVNPNGPLHVGHGRYAAYGDALGRLLAFSGHRVTTEFYINDYGRQMDMFGQSIAARYAQSFDLALAVPEDGYQGGYIKDLAAQVRAENGDEWLGALREYGLGPGAAEAVRAFRMRGTELVLAQMRRELAGYRVVFDNWFSETVLHAEGRVEGIIAQLLDSGDAYRKDDAVWLRTTPYGDDKDRVLIRSNDVPTYFAADIAYHKDKIDRGYDHLINVWGADHHGYIPRMKAAVEILSHDPDMLELIIGQLVSLFEGGEARQMSTRRGEMVTLTELTDAIGIDAARFFLVMRSHDQTLDLDLDLAREQSQENPVFYVQYAHARIASILRNLPEGLAAGFDPAQPLFETVQERDLIKKLDEFPSIVRHAADRRAPHRIASYAQDLASEFHSFYKQCRVIGSEPAIAQSRVALCLITRRVIARCLDTLGVSAPESM